MTNLTLSTRQMDQLAPRDTRPAEKLPQSQAIAPQRVWWLFALVAVLAIGLVGGLGSWAMLAPMRSAVQTSGQFGVLGNRMVIQHLEGGIVREIAVQEGQSVRKGDVIARLDDTRPRASLSILESQLANALATEARLDAEFNGRDVMVASPELAQMIKRNPDLRGIVQIQQDLFSANRRLLAGRIDILLDRTAQMERQRDGIIERIAAQKGQVKLLQEDLDGIASLVEEGLATRSRLLTMRLQEAELLGDIAISQTDLQSIENGVSEQKENQLQVSRDAITAIADQRQQNGQALNDLRQRVSAAIDVLNRTTIRAPHDGSIMELKLNTIGQVIAPGEEVAEILPAGADVAVLVQVRPDDIDQVHAGGAARIRLTAFNMRTTPTVEGHVVRVSPDSLLDATTGQPYYSAVVELDEGALDQLPDLSVLPGMQAQVMITTGEHTVADYLLSPILGGMEVAMRDSM